MNSTGRNPSSAHTITSSEPSSRNTIPNHSSSFTKVLHRTSGTQISSAQPETSTSNTPGIARSTTGVRSFMIRDIVSGPWFHVFSSTVSSLLGVPIATITIHPILLWELKPLRVIVQAHSIRDTVSGFGPVAGVVTQSVFGWLMIRAR